MSLKTRYSVREIAEAVLLDRERGNRLRVGEAGVSICCDTMRETFRISVSVRVARVTSVLLI